LVRAVTQYWHPLAKTRNTVSAAAMKTNAARSITCCAILNGQNGHHAKSRGDVLFQIPSWDKSGAPVLVRILPLTVNVYSEGTFSTLYVEGEGELVLTPMQTNLLPARSFSVKTLNTENGPHQDESVLR
jgi:hypothetical protein